MKTRFATDPTSAKVSGFDHSTAVINGFGFVGIAFVYVAVPALFALPWLTVLLASVAAAGAVALAMLPLRYTVNVGPRAIFLTRSWAGFTYQRLEIRNGPGLEFLVIGTGDWGDEGHWPGAHYCQIISPGTGDLLIGTPGGAVALAAWLSAQADRIAAVMPDDQTS